MLKLQNLRDRLLPIKTKRDMFRERQSELNKRMADISVKTSQLETAIEITGLVIQGRYAKTTKFLEDVMTSGLQPTFDESFSVKLVNKRKANKNNSTFLLACSKYPGFLPFKGCQGDGAKQVTELILIIVLTSIINGRKIIFVDEPLTGIHKGARQEAIATFLSKICNDLGVQLIMVTHEESIMIKADNVIKIK